MQVIAVEGGPVRRGIKLPVRHGASRPRGLADWLKAFRHGDVQIVRLMCFCLKGD